jgi:magnesium chelatase family protein
MQLIRGEPLPEAHLGSAVGPHRYAKRIEVPRPEYEKLFDDRLGEPSTAIRERVEAARERQRQRFGDTGFMANADAPALAAQV